MAKKVFLIDVARCMGCYSCQTACKDEHCGNDWTPYAKPQPDLGQFWLKLIEHTEGTTPKVRVHYVPTLCNHCKNPACMAACNIGAISRHEDHDFVIIEPDKCTGCGDCAAACPYQAIYMNGELGIAQKCTGCAHLLDNGFIEPRCVEACPVDALRFVDEDEEADVLAGAEVRMPGEGTKPQVYYTNMPGRFVAGLVYDPETKDIVRDARVRLLSGGKRREVRTDLFGDFWFEDLPFGLYDLYIEAEGYKVKAIKGIKTAEGLSVNLGDIPLEKSDEKPITAEEWEKVKTDATTEMSADSQRFARA
jgi:Fe-S-cluster-containing dehydrogenase component